MDAITRTILGGIDRHRSHMFDKYYNRPVFSVFVVHAHSSRTTQHGIHSLYCFAADIKLVKYKVQYKINVRLKHKDV